jgi:hypothetical protein
MFDLFYLAIAVLVVTIVVVILRAVRITKASIERAGREMPLSRPDVAREVADRIRRADVRCPRCGQQTFAMLGTGNRHKCDDEMCGFEFEGPDHFPKDVA